MTAVPQIAFRPQCLETAPRQASIAPRRTDSQLQVPPYCQRTEPDLGYPRSPDGPAVLNTVRALTHSARTGGHDLRRSRRVGSPHSGSSTFEEIFLCSHVHSRKLPRSNENTRELMSHLSCRTPRTATSGVDFRQTCCVKSGDQSKKEPGPCHLRIQGTIHPRRVVQLLG